MTDTAPMTDEQIAAALSTVESERKQIVVWLRTSGHSDPGAFAQRAYATAFADAIERGDYLATPVEQPASAAEQGWGFRAIKPTSPEHAAVLEDLARRIDDE